MSKVKLIKTFIMKGYIIKLIIRVIIFLVVLSGYLLDKNRFFELMKQIC